MPREHAEPAPQCVAADGVHKRAHRELVHISGTAPHACLRDIAPPARAGVVQRFSVGFRGPLCIASGLSGVPFWRFAGGAMLGALGTMPLQLGAVRALMLLHGPDTADMRAHGSARDLYHLLEISDAHLTAEPTEAHHARIRPAHLSALAALGSSGPLTGLHASCCRAG